MPITPNDIKVFAAVRMSDTEDAGGQMSGTALQDGAENNVFNDISSTDFAFGRLSLKKTWPAVVNLGVDTLLGAHVIIEDVPDQANVRGWAMLGTGASDTRGQALARLQRSHWEALGASGLQWAAAGSAYARARIRCPGGTVPLHAGAVIYTAVTDGEPYGSPALLLTAVEVPDTDPTWATGFPGISAGDKVYAVTFDGTVETSAGLLARLGVPSPTSPRVVTTRPVTGTLAIGATHCDVDTLLAAIVPKQPGMAAGSAAQIGIDANTVPAGGVAAAFRAGDGLVVHHTAEVAPATYANGNTVNVGRTNLSGVRLVGANGASIASGWTANLSTGVVTINDISGWSQPVRVRHTIEEVLACARTGYPEVSGGSAGSSTSEATSPFVLSAGLTMYCGRPNVGSIRVISKTGQDITDTPVVTGLGATVQAFLIDRAAGTARFLNSPSDVGPFIASHSPVTLVSSGTYTAIAAASSPASPLNRITFNRPLTRAFPAGTLVSSMLFLGDLQARVAAVWSQESWGDVWADSRIGPSIPAQYQQGVNPILVSNAGTVSERWAFIFLTSTTFRLVGETLGVVAQGSINSDFSPINPATGQPYFTIAATGWGAWSAGNVLRLNTFGANAPVWVARATLPSAPNTSTDSLTIAVRGDLDA